MSSYAGPIPLPVVPIDSFLSFTLSREIWLGSIKVHAELTKNLLEKEIFFSFKFSISLCKASKARTTPFPIKHFVFWCNMPDGIR